MRELRFGRYHSQLRQLFCCTVMALLLSGCQSLFYMPLHDKIYEPTQINMNPEDVFLLTESGNKIHGWYFSSKTKDSKGTVLFFHGNAENITSHFLMFRWLPEQGYNYFIFDYPGYGLSSGKPTPESTVESGVAAAQWIRQKKDQRSLIIYGQSLGGIIAMKTAEELKEQVPLKAVIIDGSFSSYKKITRRVLNRKWWTWWLQPVSYLFISDAEAPEPLNQISPVPLLFIHGDQDSVIEPESSQEMFQASTEPKELWIIPGGGHGNLYEIHQGQLRQRLLNYLESRQK